MGGLVPGRAVVPEASLLQQLEPAVQVVGILADRAPQQPQVPFLLIPGGGDFPVVTQMSDCPVEAVHPSAGAFQIQTHALAGILVDAVAEPDLLVVAEQSQQIRFAGPSVRPLIVHDHGGGPGILVRQQVLDLIGEAGGDPLVGVQKEDPIPIAGGRPKRGVASRGEIIPPGVVQQARAGGLQQLHGSIGGTGVHDHQLVPQTLDRVQESREHFLLVEYDHAKAQTRHAVLRLKG